MSSHPVRRSRAVLVLLGACSLAILFAWVGGPAWSGPQEAPAWKQARAAADAVVAKLPSPTPAISLRYEGDLIIQGLWAGEVTLHARIARLGTQWVWRVTETSFLDWAGGEVHEKTMLHLGRDLGVLSGTYERTEKGRTTSLGFSRGEGGAFDVQRRVKQGEAWGKMETLRMKTPARATATLPAALLFLRAARPTAGTRYALPWIASAAWKDPVHATAGTRLHLTGQGDGTFEAGGKAFDTTRVTFSSGGTAWTLHVARDWRTLVALVSKAGDVRIVPRGLGGERITADPRQPATTWKQAFLKFGFGYHRAQADLLEEAFHWEAMYDHEVRVLKRWPKDRPLAAFKKAWIAEFIANSKHRDVPATRRLLAMTLATGKVKKQTADEVVFWAHPNFGGGVQKTYYLRKKDGVWGIVRIDF